MGLPPWGCVGRVCGARLPSPRETVERTQIDTLGSQDFDSLLEKWQTIISFPNDSSWSGQLGRPCQCLHALKNHTPAVPHLRLAVVHPDVRVGENFLFQNLVDVQHPFKSRNNIDVVEENKHLLSVAQPDLHCTERSVQTQRKQERHEGIAFLPSLPLWDVLHVPYFILPQIR